MSSTASQVKYSYSLWSPSDTVKDVAESLGISNLPDEVSKSLAMDIEYRINEVLEEAKKFMKHSRRSVLTPLDISHAFRVLNVEPLYGYDSNRPVKFREAILGPGQTLYYIEDEEVDFERIINMPLPKVPREVNFTAHWLAIEGVQPSIPQNPLLSETRSSATGQSGAGVAEVEVKPLVKHALSKELQLYFDRIVAVLTENTPDDEASAIMRNAALSSLGNDPGLHQLIPYFIQFVAEKIRLNLKNTAVLDLMLQVLHRLLSNPTIFIEPYIHSVMPLILTLLVGKRVGDSQTSTKEQYQIRDFAASLLNHVCTKYSDTYHTLKPRVTRTLLKAFMNPNKSPGTHYGALSGLRAMGPEVVRMIVLSNLKDWSAISCSAPGLSEEDQRRLATVVLDCLRSLIDPEISTIDEISTEDRKSFTDFVGPEVEKLVTEAADSEKIIKAVLESQKFP
ncbi:uncharacterized protein V1516DRAFT_635774 [Lipomyces oligophaga]|uniref:uncharacterized protein n=1 Tax=Lipomyces oligophaga TaxID=45792 RepID=UPI0034CD1E23